MNEYAVSLTACRKMLADCSADTVYRLVRTGKLTKVKILGRSGITTRSIAALIEEQA